MDATSKIKDSKEILEEKIGDIILNLKINIEELRIDLYLRNGNQVCIQFNNYNQYSYSIIFSNILLDRCRFDNYDDHWKVTTKPHHFHPRYLKEGKESPMIGDPIKDIHLLGELLISEKLYLPEFRF